MKAVIAALNAIIEGNKTGTWDLPLPPSSDCKLALHAIESQSLAINALRLVLAAAYEQDTPTKAAAVDHAEKLLALHDAYMLKHSIRDVRDVVVELPPKPADSPAAKKPVADQDVSDLV